MITSMRYLISIAMLTLLITATLAQEEDRITTPIASPYSSMTTTVGLTDVTIEYFRPKVKGREIFGNGADFLVPFKDIWRTGANSGSKVTFSTDVTIAGTTVEAGSYLILSKPDALNWDIMLYSDVSLGGNMAAFDESNVVVTYQSESTRILTPVETLTFNVSDISEDNTSASIELAWADVSVKLPFEVNFRDAVMADIDEKMMADEILPGNYTTAANFYLDFDGDLSKALDWMNSYLAIEGNETHFWHVHTKARILAAMGNTESAIETARASLDMAKDYPAGDFGYIQRNMELIASLR